ncbi:MAG: Hsp20/alpha crystallin family protein [Bacteroidota bacterium]
MTFVNVNPRRRRRHYNASPFFNIVNEVFNNSAAEMGSRNVKSKPAVNIIEGKENFKLEVAAPGINKSDFNIHIEKDVLTISAKKEHHVEEGTQYSRREFNYNEFERTFHLPETIDTTKIEANFNNGILTITLAKKEEAKELPARNIEVK